MTTKLLFLIALIPLLMLTSPTLSNADSFTDKMAAKVAECTPMKQGGWDMKVMYGNMTTLNGHLVHEASWYKMFDIYNKQCANVTGYLQP